MYRYAGDEPTVQTVVVLSTRAWEVFGDAFFFPLSQAAAVRFGVPRRILQIRWSFFTGDTGGAHAWREHKEARQNMKRKSYM